MDDPILSAINVATGRAPKPLEPSAEDQSPESFSKPFTHALMGHQQALDDAGITGSRLNMFLAQLAHESNGFQSTTELPSQYASSQSAYKGRGWIQLTGQSNYQDMSNKLGIDLVNNPEAAADPDVGMKVAIQYWKDHKLNGLADQGQFDGITQAINGGQNGASSRHMWLNKVNQAMASGSSLDQAVDSLQNNKKMPDLYNAPGEAAMSAPLPSGRMPFKISDYLSDSFHQSRNETLSGAWTGVLNQVNPVLEDIHQKTGKTFDLDTTGIFNEYFRGDNVLGNPIESLGKKYSQMVTDLGRSHPDVKIPSFSELLDKTATQLNNYEQQTADENSRVGLAPWVAGFAPKVAGWMSDPFNAVTSTAVAASLGALAPAATASLVGSALIQGGLGMAITQGLQEPLVQKENALLGKEHGLKQALEDVGSAAVGGTVGVGLLGGLGKLLGRAFKGKSIQGIHEDLKTPEGAKTLAEQLDVAGNSSDAEAARRLDAQMEANPAGRSTEATQGMSVKLDQMYNNIEMGQSPGVIPSEITGIKGPIKPLTDLDLEAIGALHEEGYMHADKMGGGILAIRQGISDAGNVSAEEWSHLAPSESEVPTAMERIAQAVQEKQTNLGMQYENMPQMASRADAELQSKLSEWGATPDVQTHRIDYKLQQLTDRINRYESKFHEDEDFKAGNTSTSPWADSKGYEAKIKKLGFEEANDQARRHTARDLEKDRQELLNLNELKKSIGKTTTPTVDPIANRVMGLKTDLPNAQAVLLNKIDLAESQLKGLDFRSQENSKQILVYLEKVESLKNSFGPQLDDFDKQALKLQLSDFEKGIDQLKDDTKMSKDHQAMVTERMKEHTSDLSQVQEAVKGLNKMTGDAEGDLSPLAQAEATIKKIREESVHEATHYPLAGDEFSPTAATTIPEHVQSTAEKYSVLRALKDCMGV